MAKLHFVKKARKPIPEAGIEAGDSYYWFKRRVNGKGAPKRCSKVKPRRSSYSTSSPFLGTLMDKEDELTGLVAKSIPKEEVISWLESTANEIESLGEECLDKSSNVEAHMKNGSGTTGAEMLRDRAEHCSELARALREAAGELQAGAEDLSEIEGEEEFTSSVSITGVLAGLVWLPQ